LSANKDAEEAPGLASYNLLSKYQFDISINASGRTK